MASPYLSLPLRSLAEVKATRRAKARGLYHVLLSRPDSGSPWQIEFGAYDRSDVTAERQDHRDHGCKASNLRIVTSNSARQSCVDWIVGELNGTN